MIIVKKLLFIMSILFAVYLGTRYMGFSNIDGTYQYVSDDSEMSVSIKNGKYIFSGDLYYTYFKDDIMQSGYIYQQDGEYWYLTSQLGEGPFFRKTKNGNLSLSRAIYFSSVYEFKKIR